MKENKFNIESIVARYSKEYNVRPELSEKYFKALEGFLELASKSRFPCFPDKIIDNIWHTFIIHTKIYHDYCKVKFGKFIHHNPIDGLKEPILGYYCSYCPEKEVFQYRFMLVNQALCDGGGGDCTSCAAER